MYRMDAVKVGTLDSGEIDYEELRGALAANAPHRPAIINVNIGTTVKGAVDDLDRVLDILRVRMWLGAVGGCGGCVGHVGDRVLDILRVRRWLGVWGGCWEAVEWSGACGAVEWGGFVGV